MAAADGLGRWRAAYATISFLPRPPAESAPPRPAAAPTSRLAGRAWVPDRTSGRRPRASPTLPPPRQRQRAGRRRTGGAVLTAELFRRVSGRARRRRSPSPSLVGALLPRAVLSRPPSCRRRPPLAARRGPGAAKRSAGSRTRRSPRRRKPPRRRTGWARAFRAAAATAGYVCRADIDLTTAASGRTCCSVKSANLALFATQKGTWGIFSAYLFSAPGLPVLGSSIRRLQVSGV